MLLDMGDRQAVSWTVCDYGEVFFRGEQFLGLDSLAGNGLGAIG